MASPMSDPAGPSGPGTATSPISLALQGGGAFGAFTWGVLDRLLEEDGPAFDAISGASAGAVNAVLLAAGLRQGGRAEARALLERFWSRLASEASTSFLPGAARGALAFDLSSRVVSPYVFNPFNLNPLRTMLADLVDFEALREARPLRLLVSATKVSDGSLRLFSERDISLDAILASSCLPLMHHAVEIDGESYWDGGYAANPPLIQLVEVSGSAQILLVQIIPTVGEDRPTSSPDIVKRLNQITFNSPLQHDLEALAAMKRICAAETQPSGLTRKLVELKVDRVSAEEWVPRLAARSVLDLERRFLDELFERGRAAGTAWLKGEAPDLPTTTADRLAG
jgi:NTE family protein